MHRNIVYIHRADFDKRPPVISAVFNLLRLGYSVILVTTGITPEYRQRLEDQGVIIYVVPYKTRVKNNVFSKIYNNLKYRIGVYHILKKNIGDNHILWLEGNYTYVALLGLSIKKHQLILQVQELYSGCLQKIATNYLIKKAKVIFMPEYNRAILYYFKFKLKKMPLILPNKPDFQISHQELLGYRKKYSAFLEKVGSRKIILYQGLIHKERDLTDFMSFFKSLTDEYIFVLVGKDYGMLSKYKSINPSLIHIDYLSAPEYLFFTSIAYIGIVTYEMHSLNSVYCAPNKIYEYASFGVPMIGNNIPGLKYTVGLYQAGVIIDELRENEICSAICEINANYQFYRENSKTLFLSVDNKSTIHKALKAMIYNENTSN